MSDGEVRYARNGAVVTVTFDRPSARNAMTWRMYEQLGEACARIARDADVRVAVFRGAGGKSFIAGTDIAQFQAFRSSEDGIAYEEKMEGYLGRGRVAAGADLAVSKASRSAAGSRSPRPATCVSPRRLALRRADRPHARQLPVDRQLRPPGCRARELARQAHAAARRESDRRGGAGRRLSQRDRRSWRILTGMSPSSAAASCAMRRSPCA